MQLSHVAHHPDFVPLLAEWHHAEFGYLNPANDAQVYVDRLKAASQIDRLPLVIIATEDGTLLGSASLVAQTITHRHLSPWLSSVYVTPSHRGRGIGSALVGRIEREATRLAFPTIHLFTPSSQRLYGSLGWRVMGEADHNGLALTVMSKQLSGSTVAGRGGSCRGSRELPGERP